MLRALVRRLLGGILLLVLLTFTAFAVASAIPQNKACLFLDCNPPNHPTKAEMAAALHAHGYDRSVFLQYGTYVWHIVRDQSLGNSWNNVPLDATIGAALPATVSIIVGGMLLTLLLALPLGALAALRPRTLVDRSLLSSSVVGLAVHPFVLGIGVAAMFHAIGVPRQGYCPLTTRGVAQEAHFPGQPFALPAPGQLPVPCGGPIDWAKHLAGPWLVFALLFVPFYLRMVRTRLVTTLAERYVMTARAKGASETRVVVRHALRNAIGPLLPMIAIDAGTAITACIYIETIFGLPGLGHLAVQGLSGEYFDQIHYDMPFIVAIVLTIGVFVVALNTLADIATLWIDPRIRKEVTP
jgi:peptide/nickel transport system permease protein